MDHVILGLKGFNLYLYASNLYLIVYTSIGPRLVDDCVCFRTQL